METKVQFERLYYGMNVYSISDESGNTVELPAGVNPDEKSLTELLAVGWDDEAGRALVEAHILKLAIEAKLAEIDAYDNSDAVNGFVLDGMKMWLPYELREKIRSRLPVEEDAGRVTTTLWYGTVPVQLPITIARKLIDVIELYAIDCCDRTAAHKAAVSAMTDVDAVHAYDHTAGYPERPVISTQG